MKTIDFRCRPPFQTFVNDWFYGKDVLDACAHIGGSADSVSPSARQCSMDLFLQEMDKNEIAKGIAMARISFGPLLGKTVEGASVSNDVVTELVAEYPDRFVGVASVNLMDPEGAIADIDKYVTNGNLQGVVIEAGYCRPAMAFDDEKIYPIYEKCQKDNIFVLMGTGCVYYDLKTSMPQAFDQVALDFPDLRIAVGHGGWPWVVESCWVALNRKNVYLSPDNYMIKRPGCDDFLYGINYLISDKMMFGTAFPFLSFERGLEIAKATVNEDVLENYLYHNAARFLGIE